jgi:hypothetical protein
MHMTKSPCSRERRLLLIAVSLLLLCATGGAAALAQNPTTSTPPEQELTVTDILRMPGKLLAESNATRTAGKFKVRNYRLEEVSLPHAQTVEINGKPAEVSKAYRLSVTGGPFPVRALPPVIWVDDVAIGYGVEGEDLTSITVVTFDAAALREGATIYLSYGDKENKEDRTALPEKLTLSLAKGDQ